MNWEELWARMLTTPWLMLMERMAERARSTTFLSWVRWKERGRLNHSPKTSELHTFHAPA
jgi:hypothetical protein